MAKQPQNPGKRVARPVNKQGNRGNKVVRSPDAAVATILARENYSRERHVMFSRLIVVLAVALCVSIGMNIVLSTRPVEMKFFATDVEGKIKQLTPIDQAITTLNELNTWVVNSTTQALTFSFANYRQELSAARQNFTTAGWAGFEKALAESNLLETIKARRYVSTAVPAGAPVLMASGLVEGRFAYKFQVPIVVTYASASETTSKQYLFEVVVVRQPETVHPRGLGIASITFE